MLDAGAIIHARTTAPEFSCAGFTHSRLWGVTRNPWNPEFGVGGSSGGSGAALASGTTTLASGSDIGGSIRIPASFNGVVGFKPPYGRVPVEPPFNLDTYCHCGPLARTVADCALYENVMAGPDPSDIVSLRPKLVLPERFEGVEGLRIALSVDLGDWPVDPEVRAQHARRRRRAARRRARSSTRSTCASRAPTCMRAPRSTSRSVFGDWIGERGRRAPGELSPPTPIDVRRAGARRRAPAHRSSRGSRSRRGCTRRSARCSRTTTRSCARRSARAGCVAGDDYVGHGLEVGGEQLEFYFARLLTPVFNIMSRCPVLNVPSGFADNGVPTGVQIVGRTYDDVTAFRVGAALERERPWLDVRRAAPALDRGRARRERAAPEIEGLTAGCPSRASCGRCCTTSR